MKKSWLLASTLLLSLLFGIASLSVQAATTLPATVIDDFEDGNSDDWGFFGGNLAGGGGDIADDRPYEGSYYLSTGWGGEGSTSVFYGGMFRNFDDGAQIVPPADPWFNVWVYNQDNATVDAYTLEITLREDLNGDGWTDGAEDSVRYDVSFSSAAFDNSWVLISVPVSSFADQATGGDGIFNGNLDEIVVVVSGVEGVSGSAVEVDFDQFSFTSGGPVFSSDVLFDDMEHGDPFGNGWFAFGGAVGGGGLDPNTDDLPPVDGGAFSIQTGWGSGGVPGFYGGFGRTNPVDLTGTDTFSFWINPDAGQDYTLEINLQDDDTGDDAAVETDNDDEFQYNCVVSDVGPCAISGGGWQLVSIPLADFFDDNSFYTAGNGVLDAVPVSEGGNGQLINIVIAVIGTGSDVNFRTDYWLFSEADDSTPTAVEIVDDYENGLPTGVDPDGVTVGFFTFSDGSPNSIAITDAPPAAVPSSAAGNNVLAMTGDVLSFAGFIHLFENEAGDMWVPQDWSSFVGMSFWFYGQNSGTTVFIDVADNRTPEATTDNAERFTVSFVDDFSGWQYFEFPFSDFVRKDIGNGALNDGFTLTQVHGYAFGTLNTPGEITHYIDDVSLYGVAEIPDLAVTFASASYDVEEGAAGDIIVMLNRAMNSDDPAEVSVDYYSEPASATPGQEYIPVSGTLTFVNGGASEQSFQIQTFDDSKWEGTERVILRLTNPVDVAQGFSFQATAAIVENDDYDPNLVDDFLHGAFQWESNGVLALETAVIEASDANAIPGQDAFETVLNAAPANVAPRMQIEQAIAEIEALLPTGNRSVDSRLRNAIRQLENGLSDSYWANDYYLTSHQGSRVFTNLQVAIVNLRNATFGAGAPVDEINTLRNLVADIGETLAQTALNLAIASDGYGGDINKAQNEMDKAATDRADDELVRAVGHYRLAWDKAVDAVRGVELAAASFSRDFPIGNDWSDGEALTFWYYGSGSGDEVTVNLKENRAADPGPDGWSMVWSEEFNEAAGTPPNPEYWTYEIGDGSINGIPGWGNDEFQYYTDDPANAAMDGNGNLVMTVLEGDGSELCYYGDCDYTSARLISWRKAEFAYGRIESRILVPDGGAGIWPAFWSLGTDIDIVNWPQTGEIDFMEYVSRLPNEIFGTIHGPGYAGGQSFGNVYDFGQPTYNSYHTFTTEWEPDLIRWYIDGILYHTATPADVAPNEWVFNDPVFLLLNIAMGGNFGGTIDTNIEFPQSMAVDYIRVYQGPDTAERFEATFTDDIAGWQQVELPFTAFIRSAAQPAGAPDDGLTMSDVWGYGFTLPSGSSAAIDQVRVKPIPAPTEVTVTTLADAGEGSLREALATVAEDGTISFDGSLASGTIVLTTGQLVAEQSVTIAGSDITVSGNSASRVLQVAAGATVTINDMTITDGAGAPQGGGILNYGTLSLNNVTVTNNTETSTGAPSFDLGGGGIYNGDGATLNLTNSTVSNNSTVAQPGGGIYGFFNSMINVTNSTVSGNVAADVAGGFRTLGNATIIDSVISNNVSTGWHGGGLFMTDGTVSISGTTIEGNTAPDGFAGGLMVATFGAPVTVTIENNTISNNGTYSCQVEGDPAVAMLTSLGGNTFSDDSCNPIASDTIQ